MSYNKQKMEKEENPNNKHKLFPFLKAPGGW